MNVPLTPPEHDHDLLQRTFGLPALRPHQQRSLNALRSGRDVLVVLSTGGGKSLCYQFPAVAGLAPAIVVSPLIALMKDQVDALCRKGIAAAQLSSTMSPAERDIVWRRYEGGELAMLYLAPEALEGARTLERLSVRSPRLLAVDEAHCISEWGESFRPSYLALGRVRKSLGSPPTIALTATATARTQREIIDLLGLRDPEVIVSGFDRPNLTFEVEPVADEAARSRRLTTIARESSGAIVYYAATRRRTEALAAHLRRDGIPARGYHAGLPADERARVQDDFLAGKSRIIVATCAFGMGVDKPDVRLVVHAGPPPTLESYYQEAGRAGRDGAPGRCVALLAPNDLAASRERIDVRPPSLAVLYRLYALVRDATRRKHEITDAVAPLAGALQVQPREVARAIDLLRRGGHLRSNPVEKAPLRVLATLQRIADDHTLDPADILFLQRAIALGSSRDSELGLTRGELASLETALTLDARLQRLEAQQLLLWRPRAQTLACASEWDESSIMRLLDDETRRVRRDVWRFDGVARFMSTTRCRRLLLLRYFGEEPPSSWCGHCDVCYERARHADANNRVFPH